jgi:hypothetical protein
MLPLSDDILNEESAVISAPESELKSENDRIALR